MQMESAILISLASAMGHTLGDFKKYNTQSFYHIFAPPIETNPSCTLNLNTYKIDAESLKVINRLRSPAGNREL